jgi:hypothetical protein
MNFELLTSPREMAESQNKELDAFLAYFATFNLHRDVSSAADLCDGVSLLEILSTMCDNLELAIASDL